MRSVPLFALAAAATVAGCTSASSDEEVASSDSAYSTADFPGSCALGDDPANHAVWVNYRSEQINCGNVNPVGDSASNAYGDTVKGRTLCMIRYLESRQPDVFRRLGRVTNGERHFTDGTRAGEAWVVDFSSGSRVQFQWDGPCGGDGNGYLKLYYKPGPPADGAGLPPLPDSLRGCGFRQTSRIPSGDTNGHVTLVSDNCGVSVDEWYWGNLASNMTMTLRYGAREVRVETVRTFRNNEARYVPQSWDAVVGDAATTYSYALGALQNKSWVVSDVGSNGDACGGAAAGLGAGMLGMLRTCAAGPAACAVDVLWTLSGALNVAASCG